MIIEVNIRTNKTGSDCMEQFEIDDDASEDEIEIEARQCAFNMIKWNWKKK